MLFDMDGVLVHAGGYWAAREAGNKVFHGPVGLGDPCPWSGYSPLLESYGVNQRMGHGACLFGDYAGCGLEIMPGGSSADTLENALEVVRKHHLSARQIDYSSNIRRFSRFWSGPGSV
jgi:hypothetical protein